MKNPRDERSSALLLLLLQVQAAFCALRCELVDWNYEILRCVAVGDELNFIDESTNRQFIDVDVTPLITFHKYNWSLINTFVLKGADVSLIHPDLFVNATSLKHLDLSKNPQLNISSSLIYLNSLQTVELSESLFINEEAIDGVLQLPNLRTLIMKNVFTIDEESRLLSYFWENLKKCHNLRTLDASHNLFLSPKLEVGANLISLNISHIPLTLTDRYFSGAIELRYLFSSHSGISAVPMNAFEGTRLTHLDLSFNSISEEIFSKLSSSVSHLNLSHNSLNGIDMNTLPNSIEVIDLSYNNISNIIKLARGVLNLRLINLRNNRIKNFNIKKLNSVNSVSVLDLSFNLIDDTNIFTFHYFVKLEWLNLSGNKIIHISEGSFKQNKELRVLLLGNNKLKTLQPMTLLDLDRLIELDLSNNLLTTLPIDLLYLNRLHTLDISCNKLFYISEHFTNLFRRINYVLVPGNPWNCGCLFLMMDILIIDSEYFADGNRPSCYIGETNIYTYCNSGVLSELDYSNWDRSLRASGRCT